MGFNSSPTPDQTAPATAEQPTAASATSSAVGIGRLRRTPAAGSFGATREQLHTWLAGNMDAVGEVTGHAWTAAVTDRSASGAPTSLVANAPEGRAVFEADPADSSSESLGRLITALVESGATIGVWLAADPRPEHVAAVAWLNTSDEAAFYLIQLEAVRIDDSVPAPWMTLIVRPGRDESELEPNMAAPVEAASTIGVSQAAAPDPEPAEAPEAMDPGIAASTIAMTATPASTSATATSATDEAADDERESSTFDDLVGDAGRRADDWRRLALGSASAADETTERH